MAMLCCSAKIVLTAKSLNPQQWSESFPDFFNFFMKFSLKYK